MKRNNANQHKHHVVEVQVNFHATQNIITDVGKCKDGSLNNWLGFSIIKITNNFKDTGWNLSTQLLPSLQVRTVTNKINVSLPPTMGLKQNLRNKDCKQQMQTD